MVKTRGCNIVLTIIIAFGLLFGCFELSACSSYSSDPNSSSRQSSSASNVSSEQSKSLSISNSSFNNSQSSNKEKSNSKKSSSAKKSISSNKDSRWPTNNPTLLKIPKSERYYNAKKYVGSRHTIAGPVVNVYQAKSSNGQPTFINIGAKYPSSECFTFLIWAEDMNSDFREMLSDIKTGNAWLKVTGYVSMYEGRPQITTGNGSVSYTWWTNVK